MSRKKLPVEDHPKCEAHGSVVDGRQPNGGADDHSLAAENGQRPDVTAPPPGLPAKDQLIADDQAQHVDGRQANGGADDQYSTAENGHGMRVTAPPPDLSATIDEIRYFHRQRVFAMDQRKRSDLALGAFLRTQLGWSRDLPKEAAAAINEKASDAINIGEKVIKQQAKAIEKRKPVAGAEDTFFAEWSGLILGSLRGRAHYAEMEEYAVENMDRLARLLPVAPWFMENVFRTEAKSLAVIIAETGDLSNYANPGKVWKRMGLAVMGEVRQGGLRRGAAAGEWIAHGYSARRRSYMFVIGDTLLKGNEHYRAIYHQRKEDERTKAAERGLIVAPSAKIPAKRKAEFISDGHIHKRSQRYMEKRLLKDIWQAWRRATVHVQTNAGMPAADSIPQTKPNPSLAAAA